MCLQYNIDSVDLLGPSASARLVSTHISGTTGLQSFERWALRPPAEYPLDTLSYQLRKFASKRSPRSGQSIRVRKVHLMKARWVLREWLTGLYITLIRLWYSLRCRIAFSRSRRTDSHVSFPKRLRIPLLRRCAARSRLRETSSRIPRRCLCIQIHPEWRVE
jgi:hypothetical protein